MPSATLHDGSTIEMEIHGSGPTVLLPLNPAPAEEGPQAEEMRKWGADPSLGHSVLTGLSDAFRVVAFDYEGHVMRVPKADTLTPDNVAADLLAIADVAGADRFAYYGYSWLAVIGIQLAIRTDRLTALALGGYPPLGGPYDGMLAVTSASHRMALEAPSTPPTKGEVGDWSSVSVSLSHDQARQFMTLYQALRGFDDRAAQDRITCPRLCFAGSADTIEYGPAWGNVRVDIAGPVLAHRAELERLGWQVRVLDGLDHMQAMQASQVLPVIRPWLTAELASVTS
ncbi:alpha/beta fold hydrolase [Nonomuraea sp. NPDC059194]|uniref:alpha/beta fold hydrolase n=1 Tax=Nonomuraea sp. NPDC059194 TaxID=3346764 RepID=UPI0036A2B2BF